MDEDFGGLRTPMTYGPNTGWAPLLEVPIGMVLRLRQRNSSGGYPNRVAFTTQRLEGAMEQRKVAELWPSPNGAWTLSYEQNVRATPLDAEHPVPLGGPETAECLRLLCLADAELRHRRINNGPQFQDAQRELASAMMNDRNNGPKHLGNMRPVGVVGEAQLVDRFVDATPWQVSVDTN